MNGLIVACATLLSARAQTQVTPVQQMTCATAIAYVGAHHRLWFETIDGPVPIYPIIAHDEVLSCLAHETVTYMEMPTLDDPTCVVGYQCR